MNEQRKNSITERSKFKVVTIIILYFLLFILIIPFIFSSVFNLLNLCSSFSLNLFYVTIPSILILSSPVFWFLFFYLSAIYFDQKRNYLFIILYFLYQLMAILSSLKYWE